MKNYGLVVSMIFHIFLMAIPFSFSRLVVNDYKEINLVIDESIERAALKSKKLVPMNKKNLIRESYNIPSYIPEREQRNIESESKESQDNVIAIKKEEDVPIHSSETRSQPFSTDREEKATVNPISNSNDTNGIDKQDLKEYHFGANNGPKFLKKEIPVYPLIAKKMRREGKVVLMLYINKNGELQKYEIIEHSGVEFVESAISALKKSKFLPAFESNTPIDSKALLTIRFKLKGDE